MDYVSMVCCLLGFLLYYNTLRAGFVYDDRRAILTNPDLLPTTPWTDLLYNDFWGTPLSHSGTHGSYRPLTVATFRLNYLLGEFNPFGYHFGNVILHCVATYLSIKLIRKLLPKSMTKFGSAVAGLLFASHPVHTEAVAGIVGRADLLSCIFFIMSILSYISHVKYRNKLCCPGHFVPGEYNYLKNDKKMFEKYEYLILSTQKNFSLKVPVRKKKQPLPEPDPDGFLDKHRNMAYIGNDFKMYALLMSSIFFVGASLVSKETGITAVGICFVYEFIYVHPNKVRNVRSLWIMTGALVIMLLFRLLHTGVPAFAKADNPTAKEQYISTRLLTFSYLAVFNFMLLVIPDTLSFDWSMDSIRRIYDTCDVRNISSLIFYTLLIASSIYCFLVVLARKKRDSTKIIVPDKTDKQRRREQNTRPCPCKVCHYSLSDLEFTCFSFVKDRFDVEYCCCPIIIKKDLMRRQFKKNVIFHETVLMALAFLVITFIPASNLFFYVGFVVAERVLYTPSVGFCLLFGAVGGHCWNKTKWGKLWVAGFVIVLLSFSGRTLLRNCDWYNEEALYRSAVGVNPAKAYGNLGAILNNEGRSEEAEWAYREALKARPNMADVHYNLGVLLHEAEKHEEAIHSYRMAIHFRPTLALAYVNLGDALMKVGKDQEAVMVLKNVSNLDGTGLKDIRQHERAKIMALMQLGYLYSKNGELHLALASYLQAANTLPTYYPHEGVYGMLGETLFKLNQDEEAQLWLKAASLPRSDVLPSKESYDNLIKNGSILEGVDSWVKIVQKGPPPDDPPLNAKCPLIEEKVRDIVVIKEEKKKRKRKVKRDEVDIESKQQLVRHAVVMDANKQVRDGGDFYSVQGYNDESDLVFETASSTDLRMTDDYGATMQRAKNMRNAGRYNEAEKYYRHCVVLRPSDASGYTNLGAIQHLNGKLEEAAESYRQSLRLEPNDAITLINLQKIYRSLT